MHISAKISDMYDGNKETSIRVKGDIQGIGTNPLAYVVRADESSLHRNLRFMARQDISLHFNHWNATIVDGENFWAQPEEFDVISTRDRSRDFMVCVVFMRDRKSTFGLVYERNPELTAFGNPLSALNTMSTKAYLKGDARLVAIVQMLKSKNIPHDKSVVIAKDISRALDC